VVLGFLALIVTLTTELRCSILVESDMAAFSTGCTYCCVAAVCVLQQHSSALTVHRLQEEAAAAVGAGSATAAGTCVEAVCVECRAWQVPGVAVRQAGLPSGAFVGRSGLLVGI
jgi:hypothetical protein